MIDAYIDLKMDDVNQMHMRPHPYEMQMYFSC